MSSGTCLSSEGIDGLIGDVLSDATNDELLGNDWNILPHNISVVSFLFRYRVVLYAIFLVFYFQKMRTKNIQALLSAFRYDLSPFTRWLVSSVVFLFVTTLLVAYISFRLR